ncbi:MAG TPA: hypothetical protein VKX45_08050 [Bryobacteraceae bacterium]|jgi:hypothetical protein|nr:hypothetical protein [Bryobacteraceae bacterium]
MTKHHTVVEVLDEDTIEFGSAPEPETLELSRNGQTLEQDTDYVLGEGDEAAFAKRQRGEPWSRNDHFTALWFTD